MINILDPTNRRTFMKRPPREDIAGLTPEQDILLEGLLLSYNKSAGADEEAYRLDKLVRKAKTNLRRQTELGTAIEGVNAAQDLLNLCIANHKLAIAYSRDWRVRFTDALKAWARVDGN